MLLFLILNVINIYAFNSKEKKEKKKNGTFAPDFFRGII